MMKDSLNKKTYVGDIEPNPKEFGIWVKQDGTAKVYDYINNEWKGGSSDNGGDSSSIEYLDITNAASHKEVLLQHSLQANVNSAELKMIAPSLAVYGMLNDLNGNYTSLYIEIDFNSKIYAIQGVEKMEYPIGEYLAMAGISQSKLDAIPRITKEQFYNLEA